MNEDIIKMAREAGGKPIQEKNNEVEYQFTLEGIKALLAAEREACAKVCGGLADKHGWEGSYAAECAATAIRARGEK